MQSTQATLERSHGTNSADVANEAAKTVERATTDLKNNASELAERAARSVRCLADDGRALAAERIDAAAKWVEVGTREKPLRALGIVAAAGVIVGLLLARR